MLHISMILSMGIFFQELRSAYYYGDVIHYGIRRTYLMSPSWQFARASKGQRGWRPATHQPRSWVQRIRVTL